MHNDEHDAVTLNEHFVALTDNGVLRVRIPKTALPQPKKIQIGGGNGREQGQVSGSSKSSGSAGRN